MFLWHFNDFCGHIFGNVSDNSRSNLQHLTESSVDKTTLNRYASDPLRNSNLSFFVYFYL
jgi:hypothetical protein